MTDGHPLTTGRPTGRQPAPAVVVLIGVALPALLLTQGLVVRGSVLGPVGLLALILLAALTMVVAAVPTTAAGSRPLYALTPVAAGLTAVTLVVGTAYFPGSTAWWVPAALLSACPVLLAARWHPGT
jgi:hypothetical protein